MFSFRALLVFLLFVVAVPSNVALAATIYLSPASGDKSVGSVFPVTVYVSSDKQAMNAVGATVSFSTDKLQVASLSRQASIIDLWMQEPTFSNKKGIVRFEGVTFDPGYTGVRGQVITIHFKAKEAGVASVSLESGTVLANDGEATEILTKVGSGKYVILANNPEPAPEPVPKPAVEIPEPEIEPEKETFTPVITSSTHPDQKTWYYDPNPVFSWELPDDVSETRVLVDQVSDSTPTETVSPPISEIQSDTLTEGVWYIHVQLKNSEGWGDVAHYKVNIAGNEPEQVVEQDSQKNDVVPSVLFEIGTFSFGPKEIILTLFGLLLIILLLLLLLIEQYRKRGTLFKKIDKEIHTTNKGIARGVNLLKQDIEEQITLFKAERPSKKLTEEEKKLINIIKHDLTGLKKYTKERIVDIEEMLHKNE